MSEVLFDIVFKGKYTSDLDKDAAIMQFSKLFKMDEIKAEIFFDGTARTLKKSLSMEKANKFREALKKRGLRVYLKTLEHTVVQKLTLAAVGAVMANKPTIQINEINTSEFILDDLGVQIVEYTPIEQSEFNLLDFQIDEVGVELAQKPEIPQVNFDISEISLEDVGAIFAKKQAHDEPDIDISNIEMEEVGATIVEKEDIPAHDINIDNLKFAD